MKNIIINETVLQEKFEENDCHAYEYLIDNAENDEQVEKLQELKEEFKHLNRKLTNEGEADFDNYRKHQNTIFKALGIQSRTLWV